MAQQLKIKKYSKTKNTTTNEEFFIVQLLEGAEVSFDTIIVHAQFLALCLSKVEEEDRETEELLKIFSHANKVGNTFVFLELLGGYYTMKVKLSEVGVSSSSVFAAKISNFKLSRGGIFPLYNVKNKNINLQTKGFKYEPSQSTLILEVEQEIEEANGGAKYPVKKIIFRNNSTKLTELHDIVKYNSDQGRKKFTLDKIDTFIAIKKWEELELDLNDSSLSSIIFKGELTKPSNNSNNNNQLQCPQCKGMFTTLSFPQGGENYCSQNCADLVKGNNNGNGNNNNNNDPTSPGPSNSPPTQGPDVPPPSQGPTDNDDNSLPPSSNVEDKFNNDPGRQAINKLISQEKRNQAEQLLKQVITAEELVELGIFNQTVYNALLTEKTANSEIYQILNEKERIDKLLQLLDKLRTNKNPTTNQLKERSSVGKWIVGGIIVSAALIIVALIWRIRSKKKKKNRKE